MKNVFSGFILIFVPADSTFDGYCFDVIDHHYDSKQNHAVQLVFKKDFSDGYAIGFPDTLYDVESITAQCKPEAEKVINKLKEKGFLH